MNTIARGDTKPDMQMTLSDENSAAVFTAVQPSQVRIVAEMDGILVINDTVDVVTPSTDGKSAVIRRAWVPGETAALGRMWITAIVDWGSDGEQSFPADGPLRLDVVRAADDNSEETPQPAPGVPIVPAVGVEQSADLLALNTLDRSAMAEIMLDNANARVRRDDAPAAYTTAWADSSGWTGGTTVVASGRMYNATAAFHPIPTSTRWVARVTMHSTGAAGKYSWFGMASPVHGANDGLAIGQGSASTTAAINRGSNVPVGSLTYAKGFPALTAGDYLLTIAKDETFYTLSIQKVTSAGPQDVWAGKYPVGVAPAGFGDFYLSANDTAAGGQNFGPLVIWNDLSVPPAASRVVGGVTLFDNAKTLNFWRTDPVTGCGHYVSVPGDNDPRIPAPVVVFMHQSLSSTVPGLAPWIETRWTNMINALNAAGYIVAASDNGPGVTGGGTQDKYGNQAGLDDYAALINWVRTHASTGPVFLVGTSMGGFFVQNMLSHRDVGGIAAAASISAAPSLLPGVSDPTYGPLLLAAYNAVDAADFATKSLGYDPMREEGWRFRGVPQKVYIGAADTLASPAILADYQDLLNDYGRFDVATVPGVGHLDASLYQGADLVAFFDQYR